MSKIEFGTIVSKIFALYYFTMFFRMASSLPSYVVFGELEISASVYFISRAVAFGLLAIVFWFGSGIIGRLIAGKNPDKIVSIEPAGYYLACLFAGFGCYLFTHIIPKLSFLVSLFFKEEEVRNITVHNTNITEKVIELVIYICLTLAFILGANGLKNGVMFLRGLGKEEDLEKE